MVGSATMNSAAVGVPVSSLAPLSGRDRVLDSEDGKDRFDVAVDAKLSDLRIKAVDAEGNGQVNDVSVVLFQQTFVVLSRSASAIDASDFLFREAVGSISARANKCRTCRS